MSWFEFSVWTLLFGYNDICFIFWQQILNRFWYLLTLSNMTDWRLYLIDYLRLMSQGFHVVAWTDCCPDAKELLNSAMPTYFVDADDAGWRRPEDHTCVWYCIICQQSTNFCVTLAGQTTVETLTCSEIVVLRTTAEMVEGLRYKLRMLGVPTDGPWDVFCDNDWVVPSTSRPEDPSWKNKHCSYAYHKARDWIAAGINLNCLRRWQDQHCFDCANIVLGTILQFLVGCWMWRNQTKPPNTIKGKIPMLI